MKKKKKKVIARHSYRYTEIQHITSLLGPQLVSIGIPVPQESFLTLVKMFSGVPCKAADKKKC